MADTYSPLLRLVLPGDDDETWGDDNREALGRLELAIMPQSATYPIYRVNPGFNATNFPGIASAAGRRFFDTIPGAIDAASASVYSVVFVDPAAYAEDLLIAGGKYLTFVGLSSGDGTSGGSKVVVSGSGPGVSEPVIKITAHDAGLACRAEFIGFKFANSYSGGGAAVTNAMICEISKSGAYSASSSYIGFTDCIWRGQTWGGDDWQKGLLHVDAVGSVTLRIRNCDITGYNYLGGITRSLLRLEGDWTADSKTIDLRIFDSRFTMSADPTSYDGMIYGNDGLTSKTAHSIFNHSFLAGEVYKDGGVGTNTFDGLANNQAAWHNIENLNFVFTG